MDTSLDRHEPPNLNQEEVNSLNKPLIKKSWESNKVFWLKKKKPTPDGFTAEFSQAFKTDL